MQRQVLLCVPLGCFVLSKCSEMITNWLEIFVVVVVFSSIFSKAVGSTFDIIDVRISVMPKYSLLIDLKKKYSFSF